jgi:hypothetical protein
MRMAPATAWLFLFQCFGCREESPASIAGRLTGHLILLGSTAKTRLHEVAARRQARKGFVPNVARECRIAARCPSCWGHPCQTNLAVSFLKMLLAVPGEGDSKKSHVFRGRIYNETRELPYH